MLTADQIGATEREITSLSEQAGDLEEIALIAMESSEQLQSGLGVERTAILDGDEAWTVRTADWTTRKTSLDARRSQLQTDREPIVSSLRADIFRRYCIGWNMPYYKPPCGLTGAVDILCTTCRTTLSPKWVQECRSFVSLHACDSCKRILVFDPDAPPPAPEAPPPASDEEPAEA
jgi:predicted  nucleic acid-binding Zn-ribbon protein